MENKGFFAQELFYLAAENRQILSVALSVREGLLKRTATVYL